jgi:hypothetical protein
MRAHARVCACVFKRGNQIAGPKKISPESGKKDDENIGGASGGIRSTKGTIIDFLILSIILLFILKRRFGD